MSTSTTKPREKPFNAKEFLKRERNFNGFISEIKKSRPSFAAYAECALEASANNKSMKKNPDSFDGLIYMRKTFGSESPFAFGDISQCDCGELGKINESQVQLDGPMPSDWVYIGSGDLCEIWHGGCESCD